MAEQSSRGEIFVVDDDPAVRRPFGPREPVGGEEQSSGEDELRHRLPEQAADHDRGGGPAAACNGVAVRVQITLNIAPPKAAIVSSSIRFSNGVFVFIASFKLFARQTEVHDFFLSASVTTSS